MIPADDQQDVQTITVVRCCWRAFDIDVFIAELKRSRLVAERPIDITELFDCYDPILSEQLNRLAQLKPTRIMVRRRCCGSTMNATKQRPRTGE